MLKLTRDGLVKLLRAAAIKEYIKAYELAIDDDLKLTAQPDNGLTSVVSYEAGTSYVRMIKAQGGGDEAQAARIKEMTEKLDKLNALIPRGKLMPA